MLSLMVLITTLIIITNSKLLVPTCVSRIFVGNPKIEDQIKALEMRVAELESKKDYLRSDIAINVEDGSGDFTGVVTVTDDEDFDFNLQDSIVKKMLGIWKQVETIDMKAYLKAENVGFAYTYLSGAFPPNMKFFEQEPGSVIYFDSF